MNNKSDWSYFLKVNPIEKLEDGFYELKSTIIAATKVKPASNWVSLE